MSATIFSEKQNHGYRRYRALARSLHARIYVTQEGRMLLVGGQPDFQRLLACLGHQHQVPRHYAPTPLDLGFPIMCDGELTEQGLQVRNHALVKWFLALDNERHRRRPNRRRSRQIAAEHQEIGHLRCRLTELFQWHRQFQIGQLDHATPYLLEARKVHLLCEAVKETEGNKQLPPLARWFARIVLWISGANALSRYLSCLGPLLCPGDEIELVQKARKFQQQLRLWKHRSEEEGNQSLRAELRGALATLPANMLRAGQLTSRLRGRTFAEHCDLLYGRCHQLLTQLRETPMRRVPAAMAALAACDGGRSPLPARLVSECLKSGDLAALDRSVINLREMAGKPGYDELLMTLEHLDALPEPYEYRNVLSMLAVGATLEEIAWVQKNEWTYWFDSPSRKPAWLRSFVTELDERGIVLESDDLCRLSESVQEEKDVAVLDKWRRWLRQFSRTTVTPRIAQLLARGLIDLIGPGIAKLSCHGAIRCWAEPPSRLRQEIAPIAVTSPPLRKWLRKTAFYQKLSGSDVGIPKSVRKHFEAMAQRRVERSFLQQAVAEGRADGSKHARLRHLNALVASEGGVSPAYLLRSAEEVCLVTAMEALRSILKNTAHRTWRKIAGTTMPDVSLARQISLADWVRRMDERERGLLCEILAAWEEHGASYKPHLAGNATWLAAARGHKLNVSAWLEPEPNMAVVDGRAVRIGITPDPVQVFLMGSYFGTCLSLGDSNEMSVLANAYDANKQVVFMYGAEGQMLARQLVVVSGDFALLGYRCYVGTAECEPEVRDRYVAEVHAYCGRWARRCGIPMAATGEPMKVTDLWYDDGTCDWHEAAAAAWTSEDGQARRNFKSSESYQQESIPVLV